MINQLSANQDQRGKEKYGSIDPSVDSERELMKDGIYRRLSSSTEGGKDLHRRFPGKM